MGRIGSTLVLVALLAGACSSADEPETAAPSKAPDQATAAPSNAPEQATSPLVGTWERETTCEELVSVLTDAGLEGWVLDAVAGNGFVPDVTSPDEIADTARGLSLPIWARVGSIENKTRWRMSEPSWPNRFRPSDALAPMCQIEARPRPSRVMV